MSEREQELMRLGNELAARLEEVKDEFGPDDLMESDDLGWDAVESALHRWRKNVPRKLL